MDKKKVRLIITKKEDSVISSLFEDSTMIEVNLEESKSSIIGNIYVGKVKNILKNIQAAFIEISEGEICYLPLEDNPNILFMNEKKNSIIQQGDEILVQVSKDRIKTKAAMLTTKLNLTGRYVVLVYGNQKIGISNKITDNQRRSSLKQLLNNQIEGEYGFIARTNAINVSDDVLLSEVCKLKERFEKIKINSGFRTCFSIIEKSPSNYLCNIRDSYCEYIDEIITDELYLYDEIKDYLQNYQSDDLHKLSFYEDKLLPLIKKYQIESNIENAVKRHIWLKSGAYIIIEPTEAFVVIDVNTGKFIGNKKAKKTFLKINLEAAKEISKQIRLRNLSGIIVVDFIDMDSEEDKDMLMQEFDGYLKKDPIKTTLVGMSKLNLVELTRKKIRKPIHEQIMKQCSVCNGSGMVKNKLTNNSSYVKLS